MNAIKRRITHTQTTDVREKDTSRSSCLTARTEWQGVYTEVGVCPFTWREPVQGGSENKWRWGTIASGSGRGASACSLLFWGSNQMLVIWTTRTKKEGHETPPAPSSFHRWEVGCFWLGWHFLLTNNENVATDMSPVLRRPFPWALGCYLPGWKNAPKDPQICLLLHRRMHLGALASWGKPPHTGWKRQRNLSLNRIS